MDFIKYIKNLLIINENLFIPGLGTFVTRYKPAEIIKGSNKMVPPSKDVAFDPDLKDDDAILENYIIKKEKISQLQANKEIQLFVKKVIDTLSKGDTFELHGIGSLRMLNNRIVFIPSLAQNLLAESYGLPDVIINIAESKQEVAKPAEKVSVPVVKKKQPEKTPEAHTTPKAKSGNTKWILIGVALPVFLVLLFIFIILPNTEFFSDLNHAQNIPVVADTAESENLSDFTEPADTTLVKDSAVIIEDPVVKKEPEDSKYAHCKNFYIIAGSFKTLRLANKLKIHFIQLGYEADTLHYGDNFRVYLKKFSNRPQAIKELERLKAANLDVWLLSV